MKRFLSGLLLACCLWGQGVLAHPMDEWFVNLEVQDQRLVHGLFRVPADQVERHVQTPIRFLSEGVPLEATWSPLGTDADGRTKLEVHVSSSEPISHLTVQVPEGLLDDNQSLVGFLQVEGEEPLTLLVPRDGEESFAVASTAGTSISTTGFFKLGLTHIVEGYDHLLFLFCLLIAGGSLRHFLVVVTAFTLGHSITLGASVLGYISLPPYLTETIIALSIVIAALMNIPWLDKDDQNASPLKSRGLLAGGFGLIHGLGFAGILKEIGVEGSGVAAPLLGFNLGVEAGQLVIVCLFFPLLMAINRWNKRVPFLKGCSYLAAAIGLYWTVERLGLF